MRVLDLFSGIGGFSLGLERAGMTTVAFCEIEEFPRKVLAKHWPDVPIYNDVRELTGDRLRQDGITDIDVICGGFPCQDISTAGNQKGMGEGTRSGLWSECARLLGEIRPKYAIFENVTALLSGAGWFEQVLWDISQVGYDAEWHCIPASELGAHHHRDRVWIIAYPKKLQRNGSDDNPRELMEGGEIPKFGDSDRAENVANPEFREREMGRINARTWRVGKLDARASLSTWKDEPDLARVVDGLPRGMDRLKALGNAVVPQIPEIIGRAIMQEEAIVRGIEIVAGMQFGDRV